MSVFKSRAIVRVISFSSLVTVGGTEGDAVRAGQIEFDDCMEENCSA